MATSLCALLLTLALPPQPRSPRHRLASGNRARMTLARRGFTIPISVIGPDGLRYPTWHPPGRREPAHGRASAPSATSTGETRRTPISTGGSRATWPRRDAQGAPGSRSAWPMSPSTSGRRRIPAHHHATRTTSATRWSGRTTRSSTRRSTAARSRSASAATSSRRSTRGRTRPTRSATTSTSSFTPFAAPTTRS